MSGRGGSGGREFGVTGVLRRRVGEGLSGFGEKGLGEICLFPSSFFSFSFVFMFGHFFIVFVFFWAKVGFGQSGPYNPNTNSGPSRSG